MCAWCAAGGAAAQLSIPAGGVGGGAGPLQPGQGLFRPQGVWQVGGGGGGEENEEKSHVLEKKYMV